MLSMMQVSNWFYLLFVLDKKNLLVNDKLCVVVAEYQGNAILPCRPTSPDINVTLAKDEKDVSIKRHIILEQSISSCTVP
jgi:hypothetical protein